MRKIAIVIPYFGRFPEWADLFFETLKRNSTIDFIFYTDCKTNGYEFKNIKFNKISFEKYVGLINEKVKINFQPKQPFKLCDLRPLFGIIHKSDFQEYDFYGWADMDVLFGDIRSFYAEDILEKYDVISTHELRISGHMAIFKNNLHNRNIYKKIYKWREYLAHSEYVGIDEHGLTNAYTMTIFDKFNEKYNTRIDNIFTQVLKKWKKRKLYMEEQYTTPFTSIPWLDGSINSNHPDTWYYKNGIITNNRDKQKIFIYLHLMNFKSSLWRHDGTKAPWEGKDKICFAEAADMKTGIIINKEGIHKQYYEPQYNPKN